MTQVFETAQCVRAARRTAADHVARIPVGTGMVLVVADGAGNSSAGTAAAAAVSAHVSSALRTERFPLLDAGSWVRLLRTCDADVLSAGHGGETTAVALYVGDGCVVGASVGDSEAWLAASGEVRVLTGGQFRKPLVGTGGVHPVAFSCAASKGVLLLASDGLFKYAPADAVEALLAGDDLESVATALAELPRLRSGTLPDDVGLVVCRFRSA